MDVCLKQFPYRRLCVRTTDPSTSLSFTSNEKFYEGDLIVFPSPGVLARFWCSLYEGVGAFLIRAGETGAKRSLW